MTPPTAEPAALLALSAQICCLGVLLQSLEVLWNWRELGPAGLLRWTTSGIARNPAARVVRWLHRGPASRAILLARSAAALAGLFLPYGGVAMGCALGSLFLAQLYYNRRFFVIVSNADSMFLIVLAALAAAALPGASATLQAGALCFMAGHAAVAYFATGKNKLRAPTWRNGARLAQIMRDGGFRFAPLGAAFSRWPLIAAGSAWIVILLQLLFPLSLFLPSPVFWLFVAGGLLLHAGIAFTMGLHDFFWSFVSTYPALWFVHARLLHG
ncbi:MAG TPA: hypothetical protein VGE76_03455 [Opitutaceae bacterium]